MSEAHHAISDRRIPCHATQDTSIAYRLQRQNKCENMYTADVDQIFGKKTRKSEWDVVAQQPHNISQHAQPTLTVPLGLIFTVAETNQMKTSFVLFWFLFVKSE